MTKSVLQNRPRVSQSGGYRPPRPQTGWDPSMQQPGYGYMQPGSYPVQPPQYNAPQPFYGWDQSANPSNPENNPVTGYDYYNQQQPQQQQTIAASSAPDLSSYTYSQIPTPYAAPGSCTDPSYSQPVVGPQQGYTQPGSSAQPASQAGYAQPAYASASAQDGPSATQQAPQGNGGYGSQSGYAQSPQGQKPPPAQPVYNQTPATYAQAAPGYSQPGYAPATSYAAGSYGPPYAQQQQQPYSDSYAAGAYGQPSYPSDAAHGTYDSAQNASGGAPRASPPS